MPPYSCHLPAFPPVAAPAPPGIMGASSIMYSERYQDDVVSGYRQQLVRVGRPAALTAAYSPLQAVGGGVHPAPLVAPICYSLCPW